MRKVTLDIAETQMQDYERNRYKPNAYLYLHVVETNLMSAQRQGIDTTQHYERLRRLQAKAKKINLIE